LKNKKFLKEQRILLATPFLPSLRLASGAVRRGVALVGPAFKAGPEKIKKVVHFFAPENGTLPV